MVENRVGRDIGKWGRRTGRGYSSLGKITSERVIVWGGRTLSMLSWRVSNKERDSYIKSYKTVSLTEVSGKVSVSIPSHSPRVS